MASPRARGLSNFTHSLINGDVITLGGSGGVDDKIQVLSSKGGGKPVVVFECTSLTPRQSFLYGRGEINPPRGRGPGIVSPTVRFTVCLCRRPGCFINPGTYPRCVTREKAPRDFISQSRRLPETLFSLPAAIPPRVTSKLGMSASIP